MHSICRVVGGTYSGGTCVAPNQAQTTAALCAAHGGQYFSGGDYCESTTACSGSRCHSLVLALEAAAMGTGPRRPPFHARPRKDHASQLAHWLQVLREDNRVIFQ